MSASRSSTPAPEVRAFVFDIDGTIIDSMPWHAKSWEVFLSRHGFALDVPAFVRRTAGRTGTEVMRELFGPMPEDEARAKVHEKETLYREMFAPRFREIAGFSAFARRARAAGFRLACATAGDPENIAFALGNLRMLDFFDAAVGAHDVARGKPEPDLFLLAAGRVGVAGHECLVFEDAPSGIEAARRAGMKAVAITSGTSDAEIAKPAHVVMAAPDYTQLDPLSLRSLALAA